MPDNTTSRIALAHWRQWAIGFCFEQGIDIDPRILSCAEWPQGAIPDLDEYLQAMMSTYRKKESAQPTGTAQGTLASGNFMSRQVRILSLRAARSKMKILKVDEELAHAALTHADTIEDIEDTDDLAMFNVRHQAALSFVEGHITLKSKLP